MTKQKLGTLKVAPIDDITNLTPDDCRVPIKSITLTVPELAKFALPGQYAMIWLYGVDEKPMGIASCNPDKGTLSFAIAKMGKATEAIHRLKKGDLLGIRGPYGKGFTLNGKNVAIIGGGTGIAPTKFLVEEALSKKLKVTLFHGARAAEELAYKEYFEKLENKNANFTYKPSTDDGSYGYEGFSTNCFESSIEEGAIFDHVYSCGPELMMYSAFKITETKNIPFQACLADRYFKCAIGLCGQCTVDPLGLRLCIDGPVLNQDQLQKVSDFGKFGRDKYGKKVPL
ncbi:MAG: dihydroorotate dehydrogenase electron transfer subunit [Candidatus Heimdallarchaeota archaeon]